MPCGQVPGELPCFVCVLTRCVLTRSDTGQRRRMTSISPDGICLRSQHVFLVHRINNATKPWSACCLALVQGSPQTGRGIWCPSTFTCGAPVCRSDSVHDAAFPFQLQLAIALPIFAASFPASSTTNPQCVHTLGEAVARLRPACKPHATGVMHGRHHDELLWTVKRLTKERAGANQHQRPVNEG